MGTPALNVNILYIPNMQAQQIPINIINKESLKFDNIVSQTHFKFCPLTLLCSTANNREEVELFLAPLEPEYCVEQAMNAILIDQPLVCIPRLTYLPFLSRA